MTLAFGFGLITCQRPSGDARSFEAIYDEAIDLVGLAERLGFDSVWTAEHHFIDDGHIPSPLILLSAMSRATRRIRLGTSVILAPLYDPIRLAEDAAVLQIVTGGRLILGIGAGWRHEELEAFDVEENSRLRKLQRAVEVLRSAGSGQSSASANGRDVTVTPRPEHPIPIWIGGRGPLSLRMAGSYADGYVGAANASTSLEELLRLRDLTAQAAVQSGRNGDDFTFAFYIPTFVWDGDDGEDVVRPHYAYIQAKYDEMRGREVMIPSESVSTSNELRTVYKGLLMGRPHEIIAALVPVVEAFGANLHLIFRSYFPGMDPVVQKKSLTLLGESVIPALRSL